jgi:hypothetical protein
VWSIPQPERDVLANYSQDFCQFGDRYFIRGILEIPLVERGDTFAWGVWAEVDRDSFDRYYELFDADASAEPPMKGTLANTLPGSEDAANEQFDIHFGSDNDRPHFALHPQSTSSLATDQRNGLDDRRYHKMLVTAGAI